MAIGQGYDAGFLETGCALELPTRAGLVELPYTHFSVLQDVDRRLAANTGVNIDGSELREVERQNRWRLEPRLEADQQAGPELYERNDFDRGHLVRRRDPVWGSLEVATQANADTFTYTVCAPQWNTFNQSKELWLGLEDYVLEHVRTHGHKLTVLTGCVFADDDPVYRGIGIPRQFFKVAAWNSGEALAATGYLLDQSELIETIGPDGSIPGVTVPPLGEFRTFQLPIWVIAELTGLSFDGLVAADQLSVPESSSPGGAPPWRELSTYEDLIL